jgi:hypothetical protein
METREMYQRVYGSKYDNTLTTTQIAKLIRADIRQAIKSGDIPKIKASVRTRYFAGGSSIDIAIKETSFPILNPIYLDKYFRDEQINFNTTQRYTDQLNDVIRKLRAISTSYNHDGSESQVDYFDVNFYSNVSLDWSYENSIRNRLEHAYFGD